LTHAAECKPAISAQASGAVYVFADRAAAERWGTTSGGDAGRDVVLNAVETAMSVHAAKRAIPKP
jgi:hypothetical protein